MWLEATCSNITEKEWDRLMKGARPLNYNWLVKKIKKELPDLYHDLRLDLWNPYSGATYVTKTHYILTSSSVEYFINKGESENIFENKQNKYVFNKMKKEKVTIKESELKKLVYEMTEKYLRENTNLFQKQKEGKKSVNESKLDKAIRKAIRESLGKKQ